MANSKNPSATAGASSQVGVRIGPNEPDSNLPFSAWTAGTSAGAMDVNGPANYSEAQYALALPQGFRRGRLREAHPKLRGAVTPFRLYFMFNPATIQHAYQFDPNATPAAFETDDNLQIPNFTQGAAISFTLRFERIFEVWKGQPAYIAGRKGPGLIGTLWDIFALDRLIGVFHDDVSGRPLGPAMGFPIIATFGADSGRSLEFFGYINAVQIEHTMFDANMTPTRTDVGISMTQTYLPSTGGAQGGITDPGTAPNIAGGTTTKAVAR